ncbi:hypothetical protein [Marimonas arenosa]|uniref:Uncharacterized protein n=1 Tax=Marimonas arenosa TaxID=1795305 RepID=A0AAE3WCM0_9RHOB|nr:hypothetical protein [Marimonas arenosa]MDQ2089312.1 hypothetical protein [Marimonas arenosa]
MKILQCVHVIAFLIATGTAATAAEDSAPAAHGVYGADWGGAVSSAAQGGGIGDHASDR